jgi:hypothetical protein
MSRQSAEPRAQPIEVDRASQPRTEEAPDDPARVEHIAREPEISAAPQPQPTRQISLRLDGANSGHVDVQLQERAGKVQIAVRTPDSGLAKSLQSDLSDLVNRLEVHGFKTESWVPAAAHQAAPPAPAASRAGANPGQEHSGSGTRDGERQQRDSNQRRPSHRAAFAETLTTEEVRTDNL